MTPEDLGFVPVLDQSEDNTTYGLFGNLPPGGSRQLTAIIHWPGPTASVKAAYGVSEEKPWRLAFYTRGCRVVEEVGPTAESLCLSYIAAKLRGEVLQ